MKTKFVKKGLAIFIASLLILSVGLFPTLANTKQETESTAEPYVIFDGAYMEDKMSKPNHTKNFSFETEGGRKYLHLIADDAEGANDSYITFDPAEVYSTNDYDYIAVVSRVTSIENPGRMSIYYATDGTGKTYVGGGNATAKYSSNASGWQVLTFDMSLDDKWTGDIDKIRLDYFEGRGYNNSKDYECDIVAIAFCKTASDVYDASYKVLNEIYPSVQSLSDFNVNDLKHVGEGGSNTTVSTDNGNLLYVSNGNHSPQVMFNYASLAKERNITALTTEDFRYTVIRYRTSMTILQPSMRLYILTGDAKDLFDMIRIEGTYSCHAGSADYQNSRTWRGVYIDMAEQDNLPENTGLKYGWQGRGEFKGFRFDWCGSSMIGGYLEVAEFLFFKSEADARAYTEAINTITLSVFEDNPNIGERETEDILMPWETEETNESTEETLPKFTEDTEETITEETTEISEDTSEVVTEEDTSDETESEVETGNNGNSGNNGNNSGNSGEIEIEGVGGNEEKKDTGSQLPFYIACGMMGGLSIASIVTVVIIRIKSKA